MRLALPPPLHLILPEARMVTRIDRAGSWSGYAGHCKALSQSLQVELPLTFGDKEKQ